MFRKTTFIAFMTFMTVTPGRRPLNSNKGLTGRDSSVTCGAVKGLGPLAQIKCFIFSKIWLLQLTRFGKSLFFKGLAVVLQ